MRPDCVLDEGQKKQRFRKMIRKQKREKMNKDAVAAAAAVAVAGSDMDKLTFPKRGKPASYRGCNKQQQSSASTSTVSTTTTSSTSSGSEASPGASSASYHFFNGETGQARQHEYQTDNSNLPEQEQFQQQGHMQVLKPVSQLWLEQQQEQHVPLFQHHRPQYPERSSPQQRFLYDYDTSAVRISAPTATHVPHLQTLYHHNHTNQETAVNDLPCAFPRLSQATIPAKSAKSSSASSIDVMPPPPPPPPVPMDRVTLMKNADTGRMLPAAVVMDLSSSRKQSLLTLCETLSTECMAEAAEKPRMEVQENLDNHLEDFQLEAVKGDEREKAAMMQELMEKSPYLNFDEECSPKKDGFLISYNKILSGSQLKKRMMAQHRHLHRSWDLACKRVLAQRESMQGLVACHLGYKSLNKSLLRQKLVTLARLFRDFSEQQSEFLELTGLQRRNLLVTGAPVVIQYCLGRYLASGTALQQLSWLLPGILEGRRREKLLKLDLQRVDFDLLNESTGIFSDRAGCDRYLALSQDMVEDVDFGHEVTPMVALAILFRSMRSEEDMGTYKRITKAEEMVATFIDWASETYGTPCWKRLEKVVRHAEAMSDHFEANVDWGQNSSEDGGNYYYICALKHELSMSFTVEEDLWLRRQSDLFTETFRSISYGEEILRQGLMYNHGVPLDKSFGDRILLTMAERFRRIMLQHEEFAALSTPTQMEIFLQNLTDAVALCIAKIENLPSGLDQYRFSLGYLDLGMLDDTSLKPMLEDAPAGIRKLTISEVNECSGALDRSVVSRFRTLVGRLEEIVADTEDFKLVCMVLLFLGHPAVDRLKQRYLRSFNVRKRRHETVCDEDPLDRLQELVKNVKEMSHILRMFAQASQASQQGEAGPVRERKEADHDAPSSCSSSSCCGCSSCSASSSSFSCSSTSSPTSSSSSFSSSNTEQP